ncbi:hypothetical protein CB0940_08460 [Cercospora beticola]|uniref:PHD-type domain-containing protein n=2 Tax=Cercospora beticola TaxID=122368 RepID=A0A2G5HQV2_CERBT|nr:hypothetical protein CB0940_08460 [Cercospora beticola]PIA94914.1 hypothetical protein CB0940_08460 [Cercospora beticola]
MSRRWVSRYVATFASVARCSAADSTDFCATSASSVTATPLVAHSPFVLPLSISGTSIKMVYREDGDELEPASLSSETGGAVQQQFESTLTNQTTTHSTTCCLCKGPESLSMIQCNGCADWFHYSCVGLQPADPPKIRQYFCPTCYRTGVGQSTWYGRAVITKHQNKRVNEQLLRLDTAREAANSAVQSRVRPLDASVRRLRYQQKRQLYVRKHANGQLMTMDGIPITLDPPHNAPLPALEHATPRAFTLSRAPTQPSMKGQHRTGINNNPFGGDKALPLPTHNPSAPQLAMSVHDSLGKGVSSNIHGTDRQLPGNLLQPTCIARKQSSQTPSASAEANLDKMGDNPKPLAKPKHNIKKPASGFDMKSSKLGNKDKPRKSLVVKLKLSGSKGGMQLE